MSYDLTIRPDKRFSEFKQLAPFVAFLAAQPHLKPNSDRGFALEDGDRWMEIYIEIVSEEGDSIEDESTDPETFNCIRAHIPYARLGTQPELDYFPLLGRIAGQVGWQLYDEQSGVELSADNTDPKRPWWRFWQP